MPPTRPVRAQRYPRRPSRMALQPIALFVVCALAATDALVAAPQEPTAERSTEQPATEQPATVGPAALAVETLWSFERVAAPVVSPDGAWVAYTVTTFDREKNAGTPQIYLAPTSGQGETRRLTFHEAGAKSPVFSPDGRYLVFSSKRDDLPPQLHRLPLGGGEPEVLTSLPVAPGTPKFTPDGARLIFTATTWADLGDDWVKVKERLDSQAADKTQAKISERRLLRYWDAYRTDGSTTHLFSLDLATRQVKDLTPQQDFVAGFEGFEWDLAPDGKEAAISVHVGDPLLRTLDYNILLVDLESGATRDITRDNPAPDGGPRYSTDGRYLLYGRGVRPEWPADQARLYRYDRKSGEHRDLLPGWDREAASWQTSADGAWALFLAQDRGRQHLYRVAIEGGQPQVLAQGGSITALQATAKGEVVFAREAYYQPADLHLVPLKGGASRALTTHNAAKLAMLVRGQVEDVTYLGADGAPVQMFVLTPPNFDPKKKWPLLAMLHGGPHGASLDGFSYRWSAELFAAHGYVVAVPNFHGSTGFGQAFADAIVGRHGDKPMVDVMNGIDHLIGRGFIDEKRMAAAGGSYGGYLVSWLLGHTDRFAAIINHAGVFDLNSQFASDATWGRSFSYGAEPWVDPDRIDEQSPSRFAKNFKTPTLILHGELDYRVPVTQGIYLHGVLTAKGIPSRIVIFPQENHWILKPQSAALWWQEVLAWLGKYLAPPA